MNDNEAFLLFSDLRYAKADEALIKIARQIRNGNSDPTFLRLLADHIDPSVKATPLGTKFVLHHSRIKAPPKKPNYDLRRYLELHVDIFKDYQAEAVKSEAASRFNVSRSTCGRELNVMRRWQRRNPEAYQSRQDAAKFLREAGDPEYQPIWPSK